MITNYRKQVFSLKIKIKPCSEELKEKFTNVDKASFGVTHQICCIGVGNESGTQMVFNSDNEARLIENFWQFANDWLNLGDPSKELIFATWCGNQFDVPILYERTIANKVAISNMRFPLMAEVNTFAANKRRGTFVDLSVIWKCNKFGSYDSLYNVATACDLFDTDEQRESLKNYDFLNFYSDTVTGGDAEKEAMKNLDTQLKIIYKLSELLI